MIASFQLSNWWKGLGETGHVSLAVVAVLLLAAFTFWLVVRR